MWNILRICLLQNRKSSILMALSRSLSSSTVISIQSLATRIYSLLTSCSESCSLRRWSRADSYQSADFPICLSLFWTKVRLAPSVTLVVCLTDCLIIIFFYDEQEALDAGCLLSTTRQPSDLPFCYFKIVVNLEII